VASAVSQGAVPGCPGGVVEEVLAYAQDALGISWRLGQTGILNRACFDRPASAEQLGTAAVY
jgi:hypothetical protein